MVVFFPDIFSYSDNLLSNPGSPESNHTFLSFPYLCVCVYICAHVCALHNVYVKTVGQLAGVSSLLPSHKVRDLTQRLYSLSNLSGLFGVKTIIGVQFTSQKTHWCEVHHSRPFPSLQVVQHQCPSNPRIFSITQERAP